METKLFMFNSKKEFWNPVTRVYHKEPYSMSEEDMLLTHKMAINTDDTVNMIRYESEDQEKAVLGFIESIEMSEDYIKIVKDMNRDILRIFNEARDH